MLALVVSSIVDPVFPWPGRSRNLQNPELSGCLKDDTHRYPFGYTGVTKFIIFYSEIA